MGAKPFLLTIGFLLCYIQVVLGTVTVYQVPTGAPASNDFTVTVNGKPVGLYAAYTRYTAKGDSHVAMTYANVSDHLMASFGNFDFDGIPVTVDVKAHFAVPAGATWTVLPKCDGVAITQISASEITFALSKPAKLSFLINGNYQARTLHLFADYPEANPPSAHDPNVLYYGPGFYKAAQPINLTSNQTLYIAGGACLQAVIAASNASNIKICGRGMLMQTTSSPGVIGICVKNCTGVTLEGIMENGNNPTRWCTLISQSKNVQVTDWKVISPWIWSTDGCDIASSNQVIYDDCFIRSGDDCIAIKGLGPDYSFSAPNLDPKDYAPNRDIAIKNVQLWSDNNNAIVLGEETLCSGYYNISFTDSDILYVHDNEPTKAALCVTALNGTYFQNLVFDNVRVGSCGQLIAMLYSEKLYGYEIGSQAWPGWMKNIQFSNISTYGTSHCKINVQGWKASKNNEGFYNGIDGVVLNKISIKGTTLTVANNSAYLITNSTANVSFDDLMVVAPVGTPQVIKTSHDAAVTITLAAKNASTIASFTYSQPEHGSITGTGSNLVYTPAANYTGLDCLTFSAKDTNKAVSVEVPVLITVMPNH